MNEICEIRTDIYRVCYWKTRSYTIRGAAVLNDPLANNIRRNGIHSSGTDDDRVLRALVRNGCAGSDTSEMTSAES